MLVQPSLSLSLHYLCYIHFEIIGDPWNVIGSRCCNLFMIRRLFLSQLGSCATNFTSLGLLTIIYYGNNDYYYHNHYPHCNHYHYTSYDYACYCLSV